MHGVQTPDTVIHDNYDGISSHLRAFCNSMFLLLETKREASTAKNTQGYVQVYLSVFILSNAYLSIDL